tara:strand:- start:918 stop:1157 length:240 start_codon:yes stop_codon:yes gene_type:complete
MSSNKSKNNEGDYYDHLVGKKVTFTHWDESKKNFLIKKNDKNGSKLVVYNLDGKEHGVLIYGNIGEGKAVTKIEEVKNS